MVTSVTTDVHKLWDLQRGLSNTFHLCLRDVASKHLCHLCPKVGFLCLSMDFSGFLSFLTGILKAMLATPWLQDSNLKITCLDADEASDVAQAVEVGLAALDTKQEEEKNPWKCSVNLQLLQIHYSRYIMRHVSVFVINDQYTKFIINDPYKEIYIKMDDVWWFGTCSQS